jgi:hypothetical protein
MLRAEALLASTRPDRPWLRWLIPALAVPIAAIIAVAVNLPQIPDLIEKGGGPVVAAWVERPSTGRKWTPTPTEALEAGDRVQLQVSPDGHTHVTVYGQGANGTFAALWQQDVRGTTTLEQSLVLDDAKGPQTLLIFFSGGQLPAVRTLTLQKK